MCSHLTHLTLVTAVVLRPLFLMSCMHSAQWHCGSSGTGSGRQSAAILGLGIVPGAARTLQHISKQRRLSLQHDSVRCVSCERRLNGVAGLDS